MKKKTLRLKEKAEAMLFLFHWRERPCSGCVWGREKGLVQGLLGRFVSLRQRRVGREKRQFCLEKEVLVSLAGPLDPTLWHSSFAWDSWEDYQLVYQAQMEVGKKGLGQEMKKEEDQVGSLVFSQEVEELVFLWDLQGKASECCAKCLEDS